jgi:hypothetical protein
MTANIRLPRGLVGLLLEGHPQAETWLESAENELRREIENWIIPGGAWIECPGYQGTSLDSILMLSTALRNVTGRDYFSHPRLRATMDYHGYLLTPPDHRLPRRYKVEESPPPGVLPSIGDTPFGSTTCYEGWMAAATSRWSNPTIRWAPTTSSSATRPAAGTPTMSSGGTCGACPKNPRSARRCPWT